MSNFMKETPLFCYIYNKEGLYTPPIHIEPTTEAISNFINQAATIENGGIRITNFLDLTLLDSKLIDMVIFKEFWFEYDETQLASSNLNINDIRLKTNELLNNPKNLKEVNILNLEDWQRYFEEDEDFIFNQKNVLKDLNDRVKCNFIIE